MDIFLSERAFPQMRVSVRRLAPVLHGVSTPVGTHRHTWLSHHPTASHAGQVWIPTTFENAKWSYRQRQVFSLSLVLPFTPKQIYMLTIVLIKQPLCL